MSALEHDDRPWGCYDVLSDEADSKVKRITVTPGCRLSYQRHALRSEHWFIVSGSPVVTLDGLDEALAPGDAVDIPVGRSVNRWSVTTTNTSTTTARATSVTSAARAVRLTRAPCHSPVTRRYLP